MCTAAARSFAAIAVLRTFLGFAESGITPAMVLIISMWYKRDGEQPSRQGAWFIGNAIAVCRSSNNPLRLTVIDFW